MMNMSEGALKLPQNPILIEYPDLDCFYLVIQMGTTYLNDRFGLPRAFVTGRSKLISPLKPYWSHRGAENFQNITWFREISHPH